ncbi:MAG TPA: DUF1360 domain-containing protein [Marmoricola sp.]|jgi:hypothetical protein|nr:DUF1360 domain-containing protein [Marmoricola sp.]
MSADTHDHIPGYVGALAAFGTTVLAAATTLVVRGDHPPDSFRTSDLVLGALATQKFTRVITKDAVTTPLRAPFTDFEKPIGSGEVEDRPREGHRHAIGELLTCPFCLAPWTATAYVAGLALAPRAARAWAAVFAIVGGSDALQHVYARVRTD